jgi:hypothetical protein
VDERSWEFVNAIVESTQVVKRKVCEVRGKSVDIPVETFTECEVCEEGWEIIHTLVEMAFLCEFEMEEGLRERIYWFVEMESEIEVGKRCGEGIDGLIECG